MKISTKKGLKALQWLIGRMHYTSVEAFLECLANDLSKYVTGTGRVKDTIRRETPAFYVFEMLSYYIVCPTQKDYESLMNIYVEQ